MQRLFKRILVTLHHETKSQNIMITVLILAAVFYIIIKLFITIKNERNTNSDTEQENENNHSLEESWLERNLWIVVFCVVIFMLRMCSEVARH